MVHVSHGRIHRKKTQQHDHQWQVDTVFQYHGNTNVGKREEKQGTIKGWIAVQLEWELNNGTIVLLAVVRPV
jgi:hypothetical protein